MRKQSKFNIQKPHKSGNVYFHLFELLSKLTGINGNSMKHNLKVIILYSFIVAVFYKGSL